MSPTLFAQPYDTSATGFYFNSIEDYTEKAAVAVNAYGERVEEFEIQFIDGEAIDCDLAKAVGLYQSTIKRFYELVENWDEDDKTRVILAVGECGYEFTGTTEPGDFEVDIYSVWNFRELAEQFVEDGLFGSTGDLAYHYIDFEAIGRDLQVDYAEATVAGRTLIYRCA